jgi:hypothetical protein
MSFNSFLAGAVVGGGLVFGALSYHVLRTDNGMEFIPKLSPIFAEAYLDVRSFTSADWARHKATAAAIVQAKKQSLFKNYGDVSTAASSQPASAVQPATYTAENWPTNWNNR